MSLYPLARPLLFALDPEQAHDLTLASVDLMAATGALRLATGGSDSHVVIWSVKENQEGKVNMNK